MKNNLLKNRPLRIKIFMMSTLLIFAALILFTVIGINLVRRYASFMEEMSQEEDTVIMDTISDSMREIASETFQNFVTNTAALMDGEFWTMRHDLTILARQVKAVLEDPDEFSFDALQPPLVDNAGRLTLQLLYSETADRDDPELTDRINHLVTLGEMMMEIVSGNVSMRDAIISIPGGASIIVDKSPEEKIDSNGRVRFYNAERRPFYVGALVHGTAFFTSTNKDYFSDAYGLMAGVPVFINGELAAVCGGSIHLEDLQMISNANISEYSDICLINENGTVIYSTMEKGELGMDGTVQRSLIESSNPDLVTMVKHAIDGEAGFSLIDLDGEPSYVAHAPIPTVGWTLLLIMAQDELYAPAYLLADQTDAIMQYSIYRMHNTAGRTVGITLFCGVILLILAGILSMFFSKRLVTPINLMTRRISEMQGDDMDFRAEPPMLTGDEIEVLARAFENMSEKMRGYVSEIVKFTAEKERLDTELSVAAGIQLGALPSDFPAFPDRTEFDIYASMNPAKEVGGDFYDFFLIDDDHLCLVMADVSGKGIPGALFMMMTKIIIKNNAVPGKSPAQILADTNAGVCDSNNENMFVTVWLGILEISTGKFTAANAGHEYPVIQQPDSTFELYKDKHGFVIGGMKGVKFRDYELTLAPGSKLFVYTDGVPEATNAGEKMFGVDRMVLALNQDPAAAPKQILENVRLSVEAFVKDAEQFDDLTMMCLQYNGPRKNRN